MISRLALDQLFDFVTAASVAVFCGLIIGLERESKGKPAGVRTLVLITLGSTIFVQISILLSSTVGDPARVAAQVVTGIGFLGAGAILQKSEQGYVAGLTTAASIWVTAAIGMVIGAGKYLIAVAGVLIVVLALRFLHALEGYLFYERSIEVKHISFEPHFGKTKWLIVGALEENLIRPDEYVFAEEGKASLELKYVHKNRNHRAFLAQVATMKEVIEIS